MQLNKKQNYLLEKQQYTSGVFNFRPKRYLAIRNLGSKSRKNIPDFLPIYIIKLPANWFCDVLKVFTQPQDGFTVGAESFSHA
jgi:hypothetical protein